MKDQFEELVKNIDRPGITDLMKWLDKSGFYKAPASTRYHLAIESGLAIHSLNVCQLALDVNEGLGNPCKTESVIIASLFHDLGKHQTFGKDFYKVKELLKNGKAPATPYERNKSLKPVPHELASLNILNGFIELTEDESWSILHHNGMYGDLKYSLQGQESQLQMIVHFADMWSSRVTEIG